MRSTASGTPLPNYNEMMKTAMAKLTREDVNRVDQNPPAHATTGDRRRLEEWRGVEKATRERRPVADGLQLAEARVDHRSRQDRREMAVESETRRTSRSSRWRKYFSSRPASLNTANSTISGGAVDCVTRTRNRSAVTGSAAESAFVVPRSSRPPTLSTRAVPTLDNHRIDPLPVPDVLTQPNDIELGGSPASNPAPSSTPLAFPNVARRHSPKPLSDAISSAFSSPSRFGGTFNSRFAPRPTDW